jgi:hypothetical protein
VGRVRYGFRRIRELAQEHHFSVIVMIIPLLEAPQGKYEHDAAHAIVRYEAERAGFAVIDPTARLLEYGMEAVRIRPNDFYHLNAAGHAILALVLAESIEALDIAPGDAAHRVTSPPH